MGLFDFKKRKIGSSVMQKLIYETSNSYAKPMLELFDKVGIIYDEEESKLVIMTINYELCRYELYKGNKKDAVDNVLTLVYNQLNYDYKGLDNEVINNVKEKINNLYSKRSNDTERVMNLYHTLLIILNINETIIEKMYIPEFLNYIKLWLNNATGICREYLIFDSDEDKKKNEYIDFRF